MEPAAPMLPPNIAPGEAILAVVGVRPLLTREVERITVPTWRAIGRLEQTIAERARELVRGGLERPEAYPDVDYEPTLKAFSEPPEPKQIEAMLRDIPVPYALPFLSTAARAYNYLHDNYPIVQERTVFGANQLEPGDFALGRFEDLLEVIDRPLTLFNMAETGRLVTKQAAALQEVYPTLYQEVLVAIVTAVMDAKAERTAFEPDFDRGMSVLFGVPGIDPNLRAQLAAQPPPASAPEDQKIAAVKSQRARLIATKSDRLELAEE